MIRSKQLVCKTLSASAFLLGIISLSTVHAQTAPAPYGLTPNSRQIGWYHRERMVYCHFGPNTFDGQEQGTNTNPNTFRPRKIDCGQWARLYKKCGFTTAFLTTKHADGFCLWQSAYSNFSVKYDTAWMGGKGDVCQMFTDSCRKYGIKPAFYISPTCNYAAYGSPGSQQYNDQFTHFLGELLTKYGPITEIWWDGYNANSISASTYKRWSDTIRQLQPNCTIFQTRHAAGFGDARWVGNEVGSAGDPCWSTTDSIDIYNENGSNLNSGDLNGKLYAPAEAEETIQTSGDWFWHPGESVNSVSNLWNIFFTSVGRNTVMLLNIPPDTNGLIRSEDSLSAYGIQRWEYGTFSKNLLAGSSATALHTRGPQYAPQNMIDTAYWRYTIDTAETAYFATDDQHTTDTIVFTPPAAITFDCAMLEEVVALGQRTTNWAIDAYYSSAWHNLVTKQGIGGKRAVTFTQVSNATQVRLCITAGLACPAIHSFGVYKQNQADPPVAVVPRNGPPSDITRNVLRILGDRLVLPAGFGAGPVTVKFIDLHGRCVQQLIAQGNGFEQRLTLPSLKPGFYLVRCSNGALTLEQKFMSLR